MKVGLKKENAIITKYLYAKQQQRLNEVLKLIHKLYYTNCGVPYTTVQRRYHGHHTLKYGRQPALSDAQELRLKEILQICAEWVFPLNSTDIRTIVQQS